MDKALLQVVKSSKQVCGVVFELETRVPMESISEGGVEAAMEIVNRGPTGLGAHAKREGWDAFHEDDVRLVAVWLVQCHDSGFPPPASGSGGPPPAMAGAGSGGPPPASSSAGSGGPPPAGWGSGGPPPASSPPPPAAKTRPKVAQQVILKAPPAKPPIPQRPPPVVGTPGLPLRIFLVTMGFATHAYEPNMSSLTVAVNLEGLRDPSRNPRNLPNKSLSGLAQELQDLLEVDPLVGELVGEVMEALRAHCRAGGQAFSRNPVLVVGIWCMWGKHRSVGFAEILARAVAGRASEVGVCHIYTLHANRPRWDPRYRALLGMPGNRGLSFSWILDSIRGHCGNCAKPHSVLTFSVKSRSGRCTFVRGNFAGPLPAAFFSDRVGILEWAEEVSFDPPFQHPPLWTTVQRGT